MRVATAAMKTLLASGATEFVTADLITFTLASGDVHRWTTAQQPLTIGANTFAVGPVISRDKMRWKVGLDVDSLTLKLSDAGENLISGQTLVAAAWKNIFDRAEVRVERFISDSWENMAPGSILLFVGETGDVKASAQTVVLTVEPKLAELNASFPRNYIMTSCTNTLFDGVCALLAANFTFAGTVGGTPSATSFTLAGVPKPDGYFTSGKCRFTGGVNDGEMRQIQSYENGVVTLSYPLYEIPAAGDPIEVTAGCDKTRATCAARFDNLVHFRGFPYVPHPDTQLQGAGTSGAPGGGGGGGSPPRGGGGGGPGGHPIVKR